MQKPMAAFVGLELLLASPVHAVDDEIVEQIDAGKAYYVEGDLARALTEFEFALNAVRTEFSNLFMATLPEPPAFWNAEKAALESAVGLFGGGVMVTRHYRAQKTDGRVTAELTIDNPMVQAFSAVIGNPIMISSDPELRRVRLGDHVGLLTWNSEERTGDLAILLGGRVLAKLVGRDIDDEAVLVDFMTGWNLDAVRDIAGLSQP